MVFALEPLELAKVNKLGLPVINTSERNLGHGMPSVLSDAGAIGAAAAEHFLERYYQSFAYVGPGNVGFSRARQAGFVAALRGAECASYGFADATEGEASDAKLCAFLAGLPKATGVFTASDIFARRVCECSLAAGLRVPEDVAVLGVDADELVAYLSPIRLASVDVNPQQIGYRAAELLDRMLSAKPGVPVLAPDYIERIMPKGVVDGQSADALATGDELMQRAAKIIREQACEGLSVATLAVACGCSRRTLELKFRAETGSPIADHIRTVRLNRAKELLVTTTLTVNAIAERAGFSSAPYFSDAFKTATGMPPGEFRARVGARNLGG
ncbi:MAG: substrate-binding domain-containing protein [Opitutaceae bacterium]|nr:substrate-binding domain-containing protein [Opitutaceae bacterium]